MSITLTGTLTASTTATHPLTRPRFCVQTWVPGSTITADSEDANHPAVAVRSPLTYSYWKPSVMPAVLTVNFGQARQVDYAHVYVRMPASGSTEFKVETFDGVTWAQQSTTTTIVRDGSIVWLFDKHSAEQIRLTVTGSAPLVATFQSGLVHVPPIDVTDGFEPAFLNPQDEYTNTVSEGGQVLGRSTIRTGVDQGFSLSPIEATWARENWLELRRLWRNRGMALVWNPKDYPGDVVYGMVSGARTRYSNGPFKEISFSMEGPEA